MPMNRPRVPSTSVKFSRSRCGRSAMPAFADRRADGNLAGHATRRPPCTCGSDRRRPQAIEDGQLGFLFTGQDAVQVRTSSSTRRSPSARSWARRPRQRHRLDRVYRPGSRRRGRCGRLRVAMPKSYMMPHSRLTSGVSVRKGAGAVIEQRGQKRQAGRARMAMLRHSSSTTATGRKAIRRPSSANGVRSGGGPPSC